MLLNGTPEWFKGIPAATGSGAVLAHALLGKYAGVQLVCERGELLTYKVIEEAIQVGAFRLGPPIIRALKATMAESGVPPLKE